MKHNVQRISRIIDEIMTYFIKIGAKKVNIKYQEEKDFYRIRFDLNIEKIDDKKINKLIKCLNCEKSEEIEEYYWELAGESDTDTELSIVGMMIDDFTLTIEDEHLSLEVYRKK